MHIFLRGSGIGRSFAKKSMAPDRHSIKKDSFTQKKFMMKGLFTSLFLLIGFLVTAQDSTSISTEIDINRFVSGTLVVPQEKTPVPLVVFIQGSGPTDRNGNQPFMKNDAFKKLARDLASQGIASFRYDKRISRMSELGIQEEDVRLEDFVTDTRSVLDHFADDERFSKLVVLGHSQGSLVGMLAAPEKADGFISVSGPAQPIDSIIVQQMGDQMPALKPDLQKAFAELRQTGTISEYNPVLESLLRPSVQPFLLSWMQYNPADEIQKLEIPVLILAGTKDIQVVPEEAKLLKRALPSAELTIIEGMNHVLTQIEGNTLENSKSYNEPRRPLHPAIVPAITAFVQDLE